jgi:hypothetical protein
MSAPSNPGVQPPDRLCDLPARQQEPGHRRIRRGHLRGQDPSEDVSAIPCVIITSPSAMRSRKAVRPIATTMSRRRGARRRAAAGQLGDRYDATLRAMSLVLDALIGLVQECEDTVPISDTISLGRRASARRSSCCGPAVGRRTELLWDAFQHNNIPPKPGRYRVPSANSDCRSGCR